MIDGRLLQGIEQGPGLAPFQQACAQGAGHVLHRRLHREQVVERGQVEAVGLPPGNGARHAQALPQQPQMAVAVAAVAQRRTLAVEAIFHGVVAETSRFGRLGFIVPVARAFSLRCILLFAVIPTESRLFCRTGGTSGGTCGLLALFYDSGSVVFYNCLLFTFRHSFLISRGSNNSFEFRRFAYHGELRFRVSSFESVSLQRQTPCARSRELYLGPDHRARFSYDDLRGLFTCGFAAPSSRHKGEQAPLGSGARDVRAGASGTTQPDWCTGYARLGKAVCDVAHTASPRHSQPTRMSGGATAV